MTFTELFRHFIQNQFGGRTVGLKKWSTFTHSGVLFPEPYIPHNIPLLYDGQRINLDAESEEYATIYAKFIDSPYLENKKFKKNFFNDWKIYLKKKGFTNITDFSLCDFKLIHDYITSVKETKKKLSSDDKQSDKNEKEKVESKYKYALVDGKKQDVGNFRVEPPGIFLGRGCHPLAGKIKKRIFPEDIIINIGKGEQIPQLPKFYSTHKWNKIIHDNTLEWIACWKDDITGKIKYVWLGAKSDFKAKSDLSKYEIARKLGKRIDFIRKANYENIISSDSQKLKQLGCALYLIDNLALRVGNEKGEDEADTVGVSSLRVEHIVFLPDNKIKLDFLGKDSIRYVNTVQIDEAIYLTLFSQIKDKNKNDDLFDLVTSADINNYLKSMMDDLTAKVFRTFNASNLFQNEINDINQKITTYSKSDKLNTLLDMFNKANIKVAMLCNHQKNISKSFNDQLAKFNEKIKDLTHQKKILTEKDKLTITNKKAHKEKINKLELKIKDIKNKKDMKIELKNLSLGTSKTNYIDPRITISFLKKHNIPIEKIFSPTLRDKFFWAMDVDENWTF